MTPASVWVGASNVPPKPKDVIMIAAGPMPPIHLPGSIAIDNLDIFAHVDDTILNIASYYCGSRGAKSAPTADSSLKKRDRATMLTSLTPWVGRGRLRRLAAKR